MLVAPFLPVPLNGSYAPSTRTFNPGQPEWSSVYSTGADLARVSITGSQNRHTLYFAIGPSQTSVAVPPTPSGPGTDPTTQADVKLDIVAMDLSSQVTVDDLFTLRGKNLTTLTFVLDGYSRWEK